MRKIYKYPIEVDCGIESIVVPIVRVLKIDWQREHLVLWAEVDTEREDIELLILCIGTGWAISNKLEEWEYLNTLIDKDELVWHFYTKAVKAGSEDAIKDAYFELIDIMDEMEDRCIYCIHYDSYLGACFAEQYGFGDPRKHNLRNDNYNSPIALCDLFERE